MISAFGVCHELSKGLGRGRIGSQSAVKLRALGRAAKKNHLNDPIMADEAAKSDPKVLRQARYSVARLENRNMRSPRGGPEAGSPYSRMAADNKRQMAASANPTNEKRRRLP